MRRVLLLLLALAGAGGADETGLLFVERAEAAGIRFRMEFLPGEQGEKFKINFYDHGCGVAAVDVDGDSDDDLYFLNQLGANALYRNKGAGAFEDITTPSVALDDRITVSAAFGDVDNDGDQDLYVTSTRGGNVFLKNDGTGRFVDATKEAGLTWVGHSQGATFFDADGDGYLDLFIANTASWTTASFEPVAKYYAGVDTLLDLVRSPVEPNAFFRNRGDGTFENRTEQSGLAGRGWGGDTAVFDYDGDGDSDIFVANMFGGSHLYRNDGGRFVDVTDKALGRTPWGAVGSKAFDYDGDGRLDLLVVDMHSDMWTPFGFDLAKVEPRRKYGKFFGPLCDLPRYRESEKMFAEVTHIDYQSTFFGNGLYRARGDGTFEEVSGSAGIETFWPWGIGCGDFDDDGFDDVYLASGMGYPWDYWRSPLLRNNGNGGFKDIAAEAALDPPPGGPLLGIRMKGRDATKSARSVAVADFDGDGRLDLAVNNFNDRAFLYMNRGPQRNWIGFRLEGTRGCRDATGAVVRLTAGGRARVGQVQAAGGYLAQSSRVVHFGLGDAETVDGCEIRWPGGRVEEIGSLEINKLHRIVEPKE
ncbi:MAG TPA: CRTAC1 family protein [Planctomycetota bacterium]|nr:CRTAC1 family protein [Planctomycetota bacterium]